MKLIKRYSFLIIIVAVPLYWTACSGGEKQTENEKEVSDTPPSISGENSDKPIIRLTDNEVSELKIETARVTSDIHNYKLQAPGVVYPAQNYVSIISTPIDGQISEIKVREGEVVQKGDELFRIESLEFGNMVAEYLQAIAEEQFQISRLERLKQLVDQTISSKSELDKATSEYQRAVAVSISTYAKLKAIGVPDHEIEAIKTAGQIDPSLKIHAPISGSFDQRMVELGQSVNALEQLGRILDLKKVLVKAYISPEDARLVNPGDSVVVALRENDQLSVTALVSSINPGLDEDNRSVVVNIEVEPKNSWPKPGENVRVEIITNSPGKVYAVPLQAVTYDGNQAVVFVKIDDRSYEKRAIEVGEIMNGSAIVQSGLSENEELAVSQVFSLKALSRYELIAEE